MRIATVTPGRSLQNRFGVFRHSEWVGRSVGSRVRAAKGGGFLHLLAPSPALWTKVLPHRTQILYLPDMALIIARLAVTPGATVLESGTGSGSLSHSLARAVAPTGRLLSFDFHHGRAEQARAEFEANGIAGVASVQVRDIQGDGFPPHLHGTAHAVFLDLPCPWLALPSAATCLLPGGRVCSFSPCMEQVQRCSQAMRAHGLTDIRTVELLSRSYDVREEVLTVPNVKPASQVASVESAEEGENGRASEGDGAQRGDGRAAKWRREEGRASCFFRFSHVCSSSCRYLAAMANEYGPLSIIVYTTSAVASATSPLRQFIWSAVRLQLFLASTCLSAICALPLLPFRLLSAALRENKMRASLAEAQQQGGYWREAAAALQQRAKREEAAREASEAAAREAAARLRKALAQRAQLKECLQRAVRELGDEAAARQEAERGLVRERRRCARLHADVDASQLRCTQLQADLAAASLALGRLREELAAATQRLTACQVAAEEAAALEERPGGASGGEVVWGGGGGDEQEASRGREGRGQRGRRGRGGQVGRTARVVQVRGEEEWQGEEEGEGSEGTASVCITASSSSLAPTATPRPSLHSSSPAPPQSLYPQPHTLALPTEPLLWRAALKATAAALLLTTLLALLACLQPNRCPPALLTLLALTALAALLTALALALAMPSRRPSASPALSPASYRVRMVAAAAAAAVPLLCACWFARGLLVRSMPPWPAVSRALYSHATASLERAISSFGFALSSAPMKYN
ncbi:unnamed protein product [Closterium sp. Yama58-4]|nr:unnamed protein product [Closterium sp. Yama58-4]